MCSWITDSPLVVLEGPAAMVGTAGLSEEGDEERKRLWVSLVPISRKKLVFVFLFVISTSESIHTAMSYIQVFTTLDRWRGRGDRENEQLALVADGPLSKIVILRFVVKVILLGEKAFFCDGSEYKGALEITKWRIQDQTEMCADKELKGWHVIT